MGAAISTLTLLSALGCGIVGGVFYAFSSFVMRGLARATPEQGIAAMQSINVTVLNPWFMVPFFGTAAACIVLVLASLTRWRELDGLLRIAGGALYLVGGIGVTIAFNVPRNDALAKVEAGSAAGAAYWSQFVPGWTTWNTVRTVAALVAMAALVAALTVGRGERSTGTTRTDHTPVSWVR